MPLMTIGFTQSKEFELAGGQTATLAFWAVEEIRIKRSTKEGEVIMVPYLDKATFLADPKKFYWPGRIRFRFNPTNWPFVVGTDAVSKFYGWVKLQSEVENADGEIINGGIDWSSATEETILL